MNIIAPTIFTLVYACLCLLAFAGVYERWMHRESFFQANRVYLLITPFLALLIPHLQIEVTLTSAAPPALQLIEQTQQIPSEWLRLLFPERQAFTLSWGAVLLALYLSGVFISFLRSTVNYVKIWSWIRKGRVVPMGDWQLIEHPEIPEAASFFNYIFWKKEQPMPDMVLQHELIHVQQGHSWDVLLMELWMALHWCNPFIYRLRQRLQETHEFIADAGVIEAQGSKYAYASLLVSQKQKLEQMPYNTFAAQLNARLRRMTQTGSPQWKVIQYALCLPLVLSLGLFFSVSYLQALPLPASNQNLGQAIKLIEQTPLVKTEHSSVSQVKQQAFTNPAVSERDTTPKSITITVDGKKKEGLKINGAGSNVMVIVDGVKMGKMGSEDGGPLSKINPEDIITVNVSKDESAVALYGEEGREGVINIITKANKDVNTNVNTNINSAIKINVGDVSGNVEEVIIDASHVSREVRVKQGNSGGTPLVIKNGKILGRMNYLESGSPIKDLDPNDIKSISILKGKAAIDKYGKDAEDGAIEIETKQQ